MNQLLFSSGPVKNVQKTGQNIFIQIMISVIQPEMFRLDAAGFSHTKTPSASVPKANKKSAGSRFNHTDSSTAGTGSHPKGEKMKKYIIFSMLIVFAAATLYLLKNLLMQEAHGTLHATSRFPPDTTTSTGGSHQSPRM